MKFHFTSYPIFLLGTIFASHMCQMSDAINIDDMLRLYRAEGDYNDDGPSSYHLTGTNGSGMSFVAASPYAHASGSSSRQVAQFSGAGFMYTSDTTSLPAGSASRTMLGWFTWNGNNNPGWQTPWSYGTSSCGQAFNQVITGGAIQMDYHCRDEGVNPILDPVSANTWYHAALVYDSGSQTLSAYINGQLRTSSSGSSNPDAVPNTVLTRLVMGGEPYSNGCCGKFQGQVADFAVFSKALSTAEISAIYNAPEGLKSQANSAAGDSCLTGSSTPPSGLVCDASTSTYKVADGGVCSINGDCASGTCDSNICKVADGGSCSSNSECASGSCESNICKVSDGGTCSTDGDCASGSCESSSCLFSLGNSCSGASNCISTFCVNSVCTDGANGSACVSNTDCSSAYCDTSTNICATAPVLDPCAGNNCSGHGRCYATSVSTSRCHCENTFVEVMYGNKPTCSCPAQTELNPDINRCISTTSAPTNAPTKSPTSSPTALLTATPTATPSATQNDVADCVDSSLAMKITVNGELKNKFCTWVARKKTESRCAMDTVSSHCPITCANYGGDCSVDSEARIKFTKEDGSSVMRYCTWIASKPNKRCEYEGAVETCRSTCKEFSVRAV